MQTPPRPFVVDSSEAESSPLISPRQRNISTSEHRRAVLQASSRSGTFVGSNAGGTLTNSSSTTFKSAQMATMTPPPDRLRRTISNTALDSIDLSEEKSSTGPADDDGPLKSMPALEWPLPMVGLIFISWLLGYFGFHISNAILLSVIAVYSHGKLVSRITRRAHYHASIDAAKEKLETHIETTEWLNHVLGRIWTVYEPVLSKTIVDSVDPILEASTPNFLEFIRLTEFTLGSEPPRIVGAKVHPNTDSDIVHMDLDLLFEPFEEDEGISKQRLGHFAWNSKIVLTARVGKGAIGVDIPVLLKHLSFRGKMRVEMKMMSSSPFIKTIDLSFMSPPELDFILKPLKSLDLMDLPGLSNWLDNLIVGSIGYVMVNPNKLPLDLNAMVNSNYHEVDRAIGVLKVVIYAARNLCRMDKLGDTDGYVRLMIGEKSVGRTKVVIDDLDPTWNETHYVLINSLNDTFTLTVMDYNNLSKDRMVGQIDIPLTTFDGMNEMLNIWRNIQLKDSEKFRGELNFDLIYYPITPPITASTTNTTSAAATTAITNAVPSAPTANNVSTTNVATIPADATPVSPPASEILPVPAPINAPSGNSGVLRMTVHQAKDIIPKGGNAGKLYNPHFEVFLHRSTPVAVAANTSTNSVVGNITSNPLMLLPNTSNVMQDIPHTAMFSYRGKVKKRNNSPTWEETFEIFVSDANVQVLQILIREQRDLLGEVTLNMKDVLKNLGSNKDWYTLKQADGGRVRCNFSYVPVDVDTSEARNKNFKRALGALEVRIQQCLNVKRFDLIGTLQRNIIHGLGRSSYFVKAHLSQGVPANAHGKTKIVKEETNPTWNETLYLLVHDDHEHLQLELWEHNAVKKDTFVGFARIDIQGSFVAPRQVMDLVVQLKSPTKPGKNKSYGELHAQIQFLPCMDMEDEMAQEFNTGILQVTVNEARALKARMAVTGKCNAYCELYMNAVTEPENDPGTHRTKVRKRTDTPVWAESFEFFVRDVSNSKVNVLVKDQKDLAAGNNLLGSMSITLHDILEQNHGLWHTLKNAESGELSLSMSYRPVPLLLASTAGVHGVLEIEVIKASGIQGVDSTGTSDPFCIVRLDNKVVLKTKVIKGTLEPVWRESCECNVRDRSSAIMSIDVLDWNKLNANRMLGSVHVNLADLPTGKAETYDLPLELDDIEETQGTLQVRLYYYTSDTKHSQGHGITALGQRIVVKGVKGVGDVAKMGLGVLSLPSRLARSKSPKRHQEVGVIQINNQGAMDSHLIQAEGQDLDLTVEEDLVQLEESLQDSNSFVETLTPANLEKKASQMSLTGEETLQRKMSKDDANLTGSLGDLSITVLEARDLTGAVIGDCFVKVAMNKQNYLKTKVARKSIEPKWNEVAVIPRLLRDDRNSVVTLTLRSHAHVLDRHVMGVAEFLPWQYLTPQQLQTEIWLPLLQEGEVSSLSSADQDPESESPIPLSKQPHELQRSSSSISGNHKSLQIQLRLALVFDPSSNSASNRNQKSIRRCTHYYSNS